MVKKEKLFNDKVLFKHYIFSIIGYTSFIFVNLILFILSPIILLISFIFFDRDRILFSYAIKFFYYVFYYLNIPQRHYFDFNGMKSPKKGQRRIYVINHASIFDVIFMSILPGAIKSIMKESYTKLPLIGWLSILSGNIILKEDFGTGEHFDFYERVKEKLERGVCLAIYPEGTRSKDGKIGKFYEGTFKLAFDTEANLVPVVFDSWNIIRPGAFWIRDVKTAGRILNEIRYEDIKDYSYKEVAKVIRTIMIEALLEIRDKRRENDKKYYRNDSQFLKIDLEMREELEDFKKKINTELYNKLRGIK
ncbi:MAG TPA: lysophospholipid acyltransferase family protein [Spirochaetota bacterium]|nr:lysophospholipid acyltransferase family protein [Spirochaetota bacterium]